jgi:putative ABC transport system permease protein
LARQLGEGAVVRTDIGRAPLAGVAVNDTLNDTNEGHIAVFELRTAQRVFAREDRIDALHVRPEAGTDVGDLESRIQNAVGEWNTVLRRGELAPLDINTGPLLTILGLGVLITLGLSGLLVYNIVSLSLTERRRDFAVAGGVGTSPRAITAGILAESGLLGLVGGVLGALGGIAAGAFIVAEASSIFSDQSSALRIQLHIPMPVLIAGVVLGSITALAASYVPARRSRRIDIAAEIHGRAPVEEAQAPARLRVTAYLAGGAAAIFLSYVAQRNGSLERWQPPLGALALAATATFLFAGVGAITPLVLKLMLRPLRIPQGPLRVAISNLVANPRRTSVMAAAAAAAVGLACVLAATVPAIHDAVRANAGEAADGRVWVSTLPANNAGTVDARPSPRVLDALAAIPGVASVEPSPCVFMDDGVGPLSVCADNGGRVIPFEVVAGEVGRQSLDQGKAILGTGTARRHGSRPGSILRLPTPTGFAELTVAGIWSNYGGNGYSVTVSPARFKELFGHQPPAAVFLRPVAGVSADELARRVMAARLDPDLSALTPEEYSAQLAAEISTQVTPFWTLQRALLFVTLVATLSTLLLVGIQRRREMGILGAVGFGPGRLAGLTVGEAVGAGLAGALLGLVAGLGLIEVFRNVAFAAIGARMPFRFETPSAVTAVVLALVVVAFGGLLPAWRTSRLQIVEAIRDE